MISGAAFLVLALLLVLMSAGDALSEDCEDDIDPLIEKADGGRFHWIVPRGTLADGELAWCYIEVREADGSLLGADAAFALHPCAQQEASFPDLRGTNTVEIACFNRLGEPGPVTTELVEFPRWEYQPPKSPCAQGFELWVTPLGHLLCRR